LLQAPFGPVRRLGVAAALAGVVAIDIARSNIAVARIVLRWRTRTRRAGFVDVPLQLRNPAGLAALACIVTSTPGTAWAGYDPRRNVVTIHVLDLVDEAGLIAATKDRYERRLMEIFPDV
jgi:multicomponent K+:H+ antiporter subunit E